MWKLPLPDDSNRIQELKTALTYKGGKSKYELTEDEIKKVSAIYDCYHSHNGEHHDDLLGEGIREGTKEAIKKAYAEVQIAGRLASLRASLFFNAARCPICAIGVTTDLDHYLPESKYELLAVYSRNLIPTCHKCNNKKRAAVGRDGIGFLHGYYSDVPINEEFFFAETRIVSTALFIKYYVTRSVSMSENIYSSIIFQMEKVQLNDRLIAESNDFLGGLYISLKLFYDNGGSEAVSEFLHQSVNDSIIRFGLNHWKTALLKSLEKNVEFCSGGFVHALGL